MDTAIRPNSLMICSNISPPLSTFLMDAPLTSEALLVSAESAVEVTHADGVVSSWYLIQQLSKLLVHIHLTGHFLDFIRMYVVSSLPKIAAPKMCR